MAYSWHQQQAIKRNGVPDYAHPTGWTVVSGRDFMGAITVDTQEKANNLLAKARERGEDGWVVPPRSGK